MRWPAPRRCHGGSHGDTTSEPCVGGKEVENNQGEQGRQPWSGCAGSAAQHVPPTAVSPSASSPGGGGPWAPWLPRRAGSSRRASEGLETIWGLLGHIPP